MRTSYVTLVVLACFSLVACNTTTVKTTSYEQVDLEAEVTPEELLLDVGVGIFNPGTDALSVEEEGVFPKIREAEARFMPYKLMETLQHTGNWGVVRVIPDRLSEMDVWVDGEILKSDGENLWLQVTVEDASGKRWFSKKYTGVAGKYSYDDTTSNRREPFQKIYNQVANDMLAYRNAISHGFEVSGFDDDRARAMITAATKLWVDLSNRSFQGAGDDASADLFDPPGIPA